MALAFDALIQRSPRLRRLLDLDDAQIARLTVLAGLHDYGKAWGEWQAYIRGGPRRGHVAPAFAALNRDQGLVHAFGPIATGEWFSDPAVAIYVATCHHGGPVPEHAWTKHLGVVFDQAAHSEIERIRDHLMDLFPACREETAPISIGANLQHLFAGLLMMADWLGSSLRLVDEPDAVRSKLIAAYLDRCGYARHEIVDPDMGMTSWRPMQEAVGDVPLSRLMLIEDMTGSGKTEASMRLAFRFVVGGEADSIRFCVPTRSAATELHTRIAELSALASPSVRGCVVRAVPGQLDTDAAVATPDPTDPIPWSITGSRKTGIAPVSVGTVDQALLAVLRVRHSWARRAMDARSVMVIDEVHAGDPYMIALVEILVDAHPGPVILLSATLGSHARQRLLRCGGEAHVPYPALWSGTTPSPVAAVARRAYATEVLPRPEVLKRIEAAVGAGARVLVIQSTVADALAMRDSIAARGLPVLLHHSRYAEPDRRYLDAQVLGLIGKTADRSGGHVLVGTQTLEQSLDIDADLLVSDACPADVLLQRAGRCHRHARPRPPGFETAQVLIVDPGSIEDRLTGIPKRPQRGSDGNGWAWVYGALPVAATLEWLRGHAEIQLPRDARALVEAATHPDSLDRLAERGDTWRVSRNHGMGAEHASRRLAEVSVVKVSEPYDTQPTDPEEHIATRLGDALVNVITPGLVSPFTGSPIECLPFRWGWIASATRNADGEIVATLPGGGVLEVGESRFRYDRDGLQRA